MKILTIIPAPDGMVLVHESGQKRPVMCLALCEEGGAQSIYPCVSGSINGVVPYVKDDAKVVL